MQNIKIWHNPKCSKSRAAMELLENNNIDANVIKYLEQTPTKEQLKDVLKKLKISATNRPVFYCETCCTNIKGISNWNKHIKSIKHHSKLK